MGDEAMDIKEAVKENIQGQIKRKKRVPTKRFSASLTDLKLLHDKQIPWGTLYGELSKSHEVMEFAWKDATVRTTLPNTESDPLQQPQATPRPSRCLGTTLGSGWRSRSLSTSTTYRCAALILQTSLGAITILRESIGRPGSYYSVSC
jgi:hypothetical protein